MGASSSDYSEWNIDDKWSSQEWKSGEMLGARTVRPVDDKFVIDDEKDTNTVTESNPSLKSRSFLAKDIGHFSKDAMQDIDKRSMIWECLCLRHSKHLYSSKIQEKISQWNRCSTYLKSW